MKHYKLTDLWLQILLFAGLIIYGAAAGNLIVPYIIMGGYQLVSCLFHSFLGKHYYAAAQRSQYLHTLLWLLILAVFSFPVWMYFGIALLLVTPFLAIWYMRICYSEYKILEKHELIHLK
jgi:hypothetical protein